MTIFACCLYSLHHQLQRRCIETLSDDLWELNGVAVRLITYHYYREKRNRDNT